MFKFNPLTGKLDLAGSTQSVSKKSVIQAILLDSDETLDLPVASVLFDSNSILFNDDEEL